MSNARTLTAAFTLTVMLPLSPVLAQQAEIRWETNFQQAQQMSKETGKPLLIHFWSESCGPCRKLDQYVFPHPEVARAVNETVVAVKVNAMQERDVAERYGVRRIPTDIFVSGEGAELWRSISPNNARDYAAMVNRIGSNQIQRDPAGQQLAAHARNSFQQAARNDSPPQSGTPSTSNDSGFDSGTGSDYMSRGGTFGGDFQPSNQPAAQNNQFVNSPRLPEATGDGRGNSGGGVPRGADPRQQNNGNRPDWQASAPRQSSPQDKGFVTNNSHVPSRSAAVQPDRGNASFQGGLASRPPQQDQTVPQAPAPPENAARFALEGYCPVTLVTEKRWVKGDPRWGVNHRGRVYLFSSEQQQQRFWAAPDAFSPILSGFDPVALVEKQRWIEGRRQHGVFFKDQATGQISVCLFENEMALQRFWQNPRHYTSQARQAMQSISNGNRR